MHGLDVETTALDPEEGELRLVQLSNGTRARVYDAYKQPADLLRSAVESHDELVAHNAVFERAWIATHLERVMNLGENRIGMRILRSAWFLRDLRFPHS
jgi:hypothetical protein